MTTLITPSACAISSSASSRGVSLVSERIAVARTSAARTVSTIELREALRLVRADPLFEGLGDAPWVYFVHSLHGVPTDSSVVAATCDYGGTVNAVFRRGNVVATQFHPEKSGTVGLAILRNFVEAAR